MSVISPPPAGTLPSLEPAYELVRLLAQPHLSAEARERVEVLLEGEGDWPLAMALAGYHGVLPLLYAGLRQVPHRVPPEAVQELKDRTNARTAHGLFLFQELGRLYRLLAGEGIRMLAVKGPVLAQHVYGSIALRPFVDLDLIVSPDDYSRAQAVLQGDGFESLPLSPLRLRLYVSINRQYTFWKYVPFGAAQVASVVDLHTGVMPPGYTDGASFDALWARSRPLRVMQTDVPMPGPEDLVMVLAFHGFKNRWDRLKYVVDLSETLRVEQGLDWDHLLRRAREERWRRVLALALQVCERLAGAELPPEARAAARDARVVPLVDGIVERMPHQATMHVEPYLDRVRLNLLAQDSLRGQARYVAYATARRLSDFVLPNEKAG
jgi:hypothetical protein